MIKSLDDIRILARSGKSRKEFCDEFLSQVATLVGADAGIVWEAVSGNNFRAISQYSRSDQPARLNLSREEHDRLLGRAAGEETPIIVRPQKPNSEEDHPTLMFGKFMREGRYLLELMLRFESPQEEDVQQLMQQFGMALKTVQENPQAVSATSDLPSTNGGPIQRSFSEDELSGYLNAIHDSIDLKLTSANVANETRRLLDCDRVSVLIRHRGKYRVFAISGQPSVNRRSNTTRLLEKLSRRLLKTGQEFWYPEETELSSQISDVLDDYLAISATRSLVVIPVFERVETSVVDPDSLENTKRDNPVIGGIVYEHCHQRWERSEIESAIELTSDHSACAIRNANQHQQLFLYPLWNLLGKSKLLTAPRMLSKTLMAIGALILAVLFMVFWTVDFYVTADGILLPQKYKPVYSDVEGKVEQLLVSHGDSVTPNQPLLIQTSNEHDYRAQDLKTEVELARQRLTNLRDQRYSDEPEEALEEKIVTQQLHLENLELQQKKLKMISDSMTVRSPLAGRVITWDLEHELQNRVVGKGTQLLEIADVNEGWVLEIDLPIRREGHVSRAIRNRGDNGLKVTFLLAADTTRRFTGKIIEMDQGVTLTADKEQVIRMKALIEDEDITIDQVRSGVTAKIYCGRTSVGYLLLHDIGEAWNKYVAFKFF